MPTKLTILDESVRPPESLNYGWGGTPVGAALLAWDKKGLRYLSLATENKKTSIDELASEWPSASLIACPTDADSLLHGLFTEQHRLPLVLQGTAFQCAVWQALTDLVLGEVVSYGELARRLGKPTAARAVGSALAANRIALFVPCHRVVQARGSIGQFRWGSATKSALLAWEQDMLRDRVCVDSYH